MYITYSDMLFQQTNNGSLSVCKSKGKKKISQYFPKLIWICTLKVMSGSFVIRNDTCCVALPFNHGVGVSQPGTGALMPLIITKQQ